MHAGIFDVFADGIFHDFAVACHCVELDFVGFGHELGDDHRVLLADFGRHFKESDEFLVVVAYVHSGAGKHI